VPGVVIGCLRGRVPAALVIAISVALGVSKVTNLFVIGVVAVVVALWVVFGGERRVGLTALLLSAGPAFGVYLAWTALAIVRDDRPPGGMPVERLFKRPACRPTTSGRTSTRCSRRAPESSVTASR